MINFNSNAMDSGEIDTDYANISTLEAKVNSGADLTRFEARYVISFLSEISTGCEFNESNYEMLQAAAKALTY